MNKILVLSVALGSVLFATSADELYQKALDFENAGNYKEAMKYYKLAAQNGGISQNSAASQNLASNDKAEIHATSNSTSSYDKASKETKSKISYDDYFWVSSYEPIYVGFARDFDGDSAKERNEVKFQINFQKALWENMLGYDDALSIGYTQTAWWQVQEDSAPFRETNYRPEIFWTMPTDFANSKYVKLGLSHESNGKGGEESRSWNKLYASAKFEFGDLSITPRIWHSFWLDEYNKDIRQYMGYGDITADYRFGRHKLSATLRNNLRLDDKNRGALEFGFMFPLFSTPFKGYLQYFTGYGESMQNYNRHVDKVMLGIALDN